MTALTFTLVVNGVAATFSDGSSLARELSETLRYPLQSGRHHVVVKVETSEVAPVTTLAQPANAGEAA